MDHSELKRKQILDFLDAQRVEKGISQGELAEECGFVQSNVSRMLAGKFSPTLDNLIKMADALGFEIAAVKKFINEEIPEEHIQPKFLMATDSESEVYILHRHYPSCLIHVQQDENEDVKFIVSDLYDGMENPTDILNMSFVEEAKQFFFSNLAL